MSRMGLILGLCQKWKAEHPEAPDFHIPNCKWVGEILEIRDSADVLLAEVGEGGIELEHSGEHMQMATVRDYLAVRCWSCRRRTLTTLAWYREREQWRCPRCKNLNVNPPLNRAR